MEAMGRLLLLLLLLLIVNIIIIKGSRIRNEKKTSQGKGRNSKNRVEIVTD